MAAPASPGLSRVACAPWCACRPASAPQPAPAASAAVVQSRAAAAQPPPVLPLALSLKDCCIEHEIRAVPQVGVAAVLGSPSHPQVEEVCGEALMIGQIR